ncbi:DUF6443 domain-containing protein [Pedobacter sp. Du54]|uniref:DUF6443 domain-containing protein n=1 Tax=Pedobacter anseongensis TaxID=3133439 RepID=UPI0030B2AD5F
MKFNIYISLLALWLTGLNVAAQSPTSSKNYILETTVKAGNKKTTSALVGLPVDSANRMINYFDGLGRPIQSVQWQGSPLQKDLVQHFAYDAFGREEKKYQPYAEQSSADASFKTSVTTNLANFYSTGSSWDANIAKTLYPFSQTVFEKSPLNRVLEQGAPGAIWQPAGSRTSSAGRTLVQAYESNLASEVRLWVVDASGASGSGYYPSGKLYKTISKDENWTTGKIGTSEEFKDMEGRVVLKRVWETESLSLDTYYVYDDLGLLRYVIPPAVTVTSFIEADAVFDQYIYGYHYDGRKRLIEKKIPGKGWEYMVYNRLDQAILTQDANQRGNYQWTFTKYDSMGRTVLTGFYQDASSRATLQTSISAITSPLWEIRDNGIATGYSNVSYPTTSITAYLTASFYDDYDFLGIGAAIPPSVLVSAKVKGLLTGTRVYQSDGTVPRWTVYYYDGEGRARETVAENHLGGADRTESTYNFAGELTASLRTHVALGSTTTISTAYVYDHAGRRLNAKENINSHGEVVLNKLSYDEIGQLKQKQLHSEDSGVSYLQSTKYARNERGWLKSSISNEFGMKLGYDTLSYPQYNGNISAQLWGTAGSYPNRFDYTYDRLNRLTSGISTGIAMSEVITYDVMGNMTTLSRDGGTAHPYFYTGNRLNHVDAVTNPYSYDQNGNTTIDGRMNLTQTYTHLNQLKHATTTGLNVYYTYNALGTKLRREVLTTGSVITDYVDGIQYTNGAIDFIRTEEGRARNSSGTYVYEYDLTDHLGNVRYTFDKNAGVLRKLQADDYYPFGLRKVATVGNNDYLYNSKELQTELGKYDYSARFYDPIIGRWNSVDPMAEKMMSWSPYTYAFNNPIRFIDVGGEYPWPVTVRSFISTPTTAGGRFYGDGRGPSFVGTSRVESSFIVDPTQGNVSQPISRSDPTIFYGMGMTGQLGYLPPDVGVGTPSGSNDNMRFSNGTASFDFSHTGKDPLTPGFLTPALDVQAGLTLKENLEKGILSISGSFTGDTFPSTEAFITDQSGKGKLFLGAQMEKGGIKDLFFNNKKPMFKVNMQIYFDKDGNFTGVRQGKTNYTVDEWNKKVQEEFNR